MVRTSTGSRTWSCLRRLINSSPREPSKVRSTIAASGHVCLMRVIASVILSAWPHTVMPPSVSMSCASMARKSGWSSTMRSFLFLGRLGMTAQLPEPALVHNSLVVWQITLHPAFGYPLGRALVEFGGSFDAQLFLNPGPVAVHCRGAEMEAPGYFARAKAVAEKLKDFDLAVGQQVRPCGRRHLA